MDLAAASGALKILLGNGEGQFISAVSYEIGRRAYDLESGDFNEDGKLDLVVVMLREGFVRVFLGKGDGSFAMPRDYDAGYAPQAVAISDFNGDGMKDLVVVRSGTSRLFLGRGDGNFLFGADFFIGGGSHDVAAGDLNQDGQIDIAVASGAVAVGLNQTFTKLQIAPAGSGIELSWPQFTAGFILEATTDLSGLGSLRDSSRLIDGYRALAIKHRENISLV